jgi:RAB protein geranylgeranyltransferase component A
MLNFSRYPLFISTLLNNYNAMHLINNKELLELKSFIKVAYNKCVEAGSLNFPILRHSKRVIKKVLNSVASLSSEDLTLSDIIIIKGFYINIVFKA